MTRPHGTRQASSKMRTPGGSGQANAAITNYELDFADEEGASQATTDDTRFLTLRAELERRGFKLRRGVTGGVFILSCDINLETTDLNAIAAFSKRLGDAA